MESFALLPFWQAYVKTYELRTSAIRGVNLTCLNTSDVAWMFSEDCFLDQRELCAAFAGLCSGLLWSLGFYFYTSSCLRSPTTDDLQVWIRVSLVIHLFADILSCVGALMAMQFLEQIAFGVTVVLGHSAVAMVTCCRHLWRHYAQQDSNSSHKHRLAMLSCCNSGCTCRLSFTAHALCTLVFLSVINIGVDGEHSSGASLMTKVVMVTPDSETLDISGRILGSSACLMSWLASATDLWRTHKSGCSVRRRAWAEILMALGNTGYLVIVFWQPSFTLGVVSYTLPWTLARAALVIFNVTTLILLFLGGRRQFYQKLAENGDCLSLRSSNSNGSEAEDTESITLWETTWKNSLKPVFGATSFHPQTDQSPTCQLTIAACYQGQQSTETSCSSTGEQDTEPSRILCLDLEVELNQHFVLQAPTLQAAALRHLSTLTPEARHDRVKQWLRKSVSEEQDVHVDLRPHERRQHSGSFSQSRSEQAAQVRLSARKNSSTF